MSTSILERSPAPETSDSMCLVGIPRAAELIGYSCRAIELKISRGVWVEGYEYRRTITGTRLIDLRGVMAWARGDRAADAEPIHDRVALPLEVGRLIPGPIPEPPSPLPRPPVRTALYRHFDGAGILLYVGISLSPIQRLAEHDDSSHWSKLIVQVTIEWFPNRPDAMAAETAAIRDERPKHNIVGNPCRFPK